SGGGHDDRCGGGCQHPPSPPRRLRRAGALLWGWLAAGFSDLSDGPHVQREMALVEGRGHRREAEAARGWAAAAPGGRNGGVLKSERCTPCPAGRSWSQPRLVKLRIGQWMRPGFRNLNNEPM